MLLTDESGATTTEYSLIAAGVGFAVTLTVLPPSITLARPIAALALLLALRRRNGGWGGRVEDGHGRLGLANAMPATPVRIRARGQPGRQSLDVGGIKNFRSDGGRLLASARNIVAGPSSNHQLPPD
jgi:hypothetical protein